MALCEALGLAERDRLRHGRHDGEGRASSSAASPQPAPTTTSSAATTRAWPSASPSSTSTRSAPAAAASRWLDDGRRPARRAGERRRRAGTGLLRPRRHRADGDRRQRRARPPRRRQLPRRRDARWTRGRRARALQEQRGARRWASTMERAAAGHRCASPSANMANAVRAVTTERGLDPRDFTLVAYGGGGPLHAGALARELAIRRCSSRRRRPSSRRCGMLRGRPAPRLRAHPRRAPQRRRPGRAGAAFGGAGGGGRRETRAAPASTTHEIVFERSADMRYVRPGARGRRRSCRRTWPARTDRALVKRLFDEAHELRFSHSAPDEELRAGEPAGGRHRRRPEAAAAWSRAAAGRGPARRRAATARVYVEGAGWQDLAVVRAGSAARRHGARGTGVDRRAGPRPRWSSPATAARRPPTATSTSRSTRRSWSQA